MYVDSAPEIAACPSTLECGLDLGTQLQWIEDEKDKQVNHTVEKPGKHLTQ